MARLLVGFPALSVLRPQWEGHEHPGTTNRVVVGNAVFGGDRPVIIAGPCAVESFEQTLAIAETVRDAGGDLLRGGAFKPRTDPGTFQGMGSEGLQILAEVRRRTGIGIVTEVLDPRRVEEVAEVADMIQVGSRSMQNFPLLVEVGRAGRPVLLKRGWCATLQEWLCAAEYVAREGCRDIVVCERGIRASCHWDYARHVLDLNVLEPLRWATPMPVIVDPSHACGSAELVPPMSRAALAAGAHGLLIEVVATEQMRAALHCDAAQGILPAQLREIVEIASVPRTTPA